MLASPVLPRYIVPQSEAMCKKRRRDTDFAGGCWQIWIKAACPGKQRPFGFWKPEGSKNVGTAHRCLDHLIPHSPCPPLPFPPAHVIIPTLLPPPQSNGAGGGNKKGPALRQPFDGAQDKAQDTAAFRARQALRLRSGQALHYAPFLLRPGRPGSIDYVKSRFLCQVGERLCAWGGAEPLRALRGSENAERSFSDFRGFSGVSGSVDAQTDGLVCELYGLREEEVGVVEGHLKHERREGERRARKGLLSTDSGNGLNGLGERIDRIGGAD
jgi:hypothetical protein